MLPAIEGYCRYLLVDASLLPGSGGHRRRIASLKGTMCAPGCDPSALRGLAARDSNPLPSSSPYAAVNAAFNAFLEGRADDCAAAVAAELELIKATRAENAGGLPSEVFSKMNSACRVNREAPMGDCPSFPDASSTPYASEEELVDISVVCDLLRTLRAAKVDGRAYRALAGNVFAPVEVRVLYADGRQVR